MEKLAEGKSIIVTGGGGDIGAAMARGLAAEGARVVVADVDFVRADAIAAAIRKSGGEAIAVAANVTDRDSVRALISAAVKTFGRLDVMFNNAGISKAGSFLTASVEDWNRILTVNGLGVLIGIQEAARQFIEQKTPGKIVNTASIVATNPDPVAAIYSASKAAVVSLTRSAAKELGQHGITVNCLSPGFVRTKLWDGLDKDLIGAGIIHEPGVVDHLGSSKAVLGRVSTPDDLVGATVFLASQGADYITGHNLVVDGGVVA